jgi:hypothetical protein
VNQGIFAVARAATGLVALLLLAGCASGACRPLTIEVAKKEERAFLATPSNQPLTTQPGGLVDTATPRVERTFWVQAKGGSWHPVPEEKYQAAEVGRPLELCR